MKGNYGRQFPQLVSNPQWPGTDFWISVLVLSISLGCSRFFPVKREAENSTCLTSRSLQFLQMYCIWLSECVHQSTIHTRTVKYDWLHCLYGQRYWSKVVCVDSAEERAAGRMDRRDNKEKTFLRSHKFTKRPISNSTVITVQCPCARVICL